MTAQLLAVRDTQADASGLLERAWPLFWDPAEGLWWLERGRVAERLGQNDKAIQDYRYVADLWRNADPELQPSVAEARAALNRLGGEPR